MATSIGDLVATLGVNNRPFKAGLSGAQGMLSGFASKMKSTLGSVAGMFGVGLGIGGLGYAAKQAIDAYTEAEQAEKKLAAVIAATGGAAGFTTAQLQGYAAELQRTTNFEDDATVSAMGILATFREIKGDNFKQATAAAQDMAAVMGTDLKTTIMQVGKALNDPVTGMTALRRAGVSFTDAQKQQIKALQKTGDLIGAQKIVLSELKNEFGGAAEAMADPLIQANNRLGDMAETIGGLLKPVWVDMVNTFTGGAEHVIGGLQYVVDAVHAILFTVRNFSALIRVAFLDAVIGIIQAFPELEKPIERIGQVFMGVMGGIWGVFYNLLDRMQKGIAALVDAVQAAFDVLQAGISGNMIEAGNAMSRLLAANERFIGQSTGWGGTGQGLGSSFREGYDAASGDYKSMVGKAGGISGWLEQERQRLLDSVGKTEAERLGKPGAFRAGGLALAGAGSGAGGKAVKQELPQAMERGSAEAWKKIVGQMYGKDKDRAVEETAKATRDSADTLRRMEAHQAEEAEI